MRTAALALVVAAGPAAAADPPLDAFLPYTLAPPARPPDAVRAAQVRRLIDYLVVRSQMHHRARQVTWGRPHANDYADAVLRLARTAAGREPSAARRVRLYEAAVELLRDEEGLIEATVKDGRVPAYDADSFRGRRLEAEAELLRAMAAARTDKLTARPAPAANEVVPAAGYTAFPDLTPPATSVPPPGARDREYDDSLLGPILDRNSGAEPVLMWAIDPAAPARDRAQTALFNAAAKTLYRELQLRSAGKWQGDGLGDYVRVCHALTTAAADRDPGRRVWWHEFRVVLLKDLEGFTAARVAAGVETADVLALARVHRLDAEADLLAAKAGGGSAAPPAKPVAVRRPRQDAGPPDTAFPDVVPPPVVVERITPQAAADRVTSLTRLAAGHPRTVDPTVPALRQNRTAEWNAAVAVLIARDQLMSVGKWGDSTPDLDDQVDACRRATRAAADLDGTPAGRVAWAETRVRLLKEIERRCLAGHVSGDERASDHFPATVFRLEAEVDLALAGEAARP